MTTPIAIERKVFEIKQLDVSKTGEFSGYASVFGNVDDGGDVVLPGAFAGALPAFLKDGFISWMHYWDQPVAMPVEAKEDDAGLFITARFHSHAEAQKARTITQERRDEGKSMGLSIGYSVTEEEYTDSARLLRTIDPLYETGLVMVPMNRLSNVTDVKAGLGSGRPFAERLELVLAESKALVEHSQSRAEMRAKEGRVLSATNRELLSSLEGQLVDVRRVIRELLEATDPDKDGKAAMALLAEFEAIQAGVFGAAAS